MPVIRREQVQLKVLRAFMVDPLLVDDHPQPQPPGLHRQMSLEIADVGVDPTPAALAGHQRFQGQPLPEAHLDGVLAPFTDKQVKDLALEEGRIYAELQGQGTTKTALQLPNKFSKEALSPPTVVHVARPIAQPKDLSGLSQMGQQGIIARIFAR